MPDGSTHPTRTHKLLLDTNYPDHAALCDVDQGDAYEASISINSLGRPSLSIVSGGDEVTISGLMAIEAFEHVLACAVKEARKADNEQWAKTRLALQHVPGETVKHFRGGR
jgi:hypothetical protein